MSYLWWQIRRRAWTIVTILGVAAIVVGLIAQSRSGEEESDLSNVDRAPLRLLDDGAGQRHFEISYPEGRPRATMILIHGYGWTSHSLPTFARSLTLVRQLTENGFRVVAISTDESPALDREGAQPKGGAVLDDVLAFYDQVRDAFPDEPVCAHGSSGGGHLALMLAVERPSIDCVSAAAPPTDLVSLVADADLGPDPEGTCRGNPRRVVGGVAFGACLAVRTWGPSEDALRRASPALRLSEADEAPPVWAGFSDTDPIIPDDQREALADSPADATIEVLSGDPRGPGYVHNRVDAGDSRRAAESLRSWLDRVVPVAEGAAGLPDADLANGVHSACNSNAPKRPPFRSAPRRDRSDLLAGAGRWRPATRTVLLAATNSCDGAESLQESGLSLWVPPFSQGRYVEQGTAASWTFQAPEGAVAESVTASLRGFIANPGVWSIGLYARGSGEEGWSPVAECDGRRCGGFESQPSAVGGVTIVPRGTGPAADSLRSLPEQTWQLIGRPTELKWELKCVSPRGCLPRSINPRSDPEGRPARRPVDPSGRPAVLSIYELQVRTAER